VIEKQTRINNRFGIHVRPSGFIVQEMSHFPDVHFEIDKGEGFAPVTGVMSLLTFCLEDKMLVTLRASGPNEEKACESVITLLGTNFDLER
jgi:phosphotransferase system HPr (HPr) family protein